MTWTTPRTWSADEIVGATDMNTHVRDNLNALKDPPFYHSAAAGNFSSTSGAGLTGVTSLSAVIGTHGGDVMVGFQAYVSAVPCTLNLTIDASGYTSAASGIALAPSNGYTTYTVWITGLASGTHTFRPMMRSYGGWSILRNDINPTIFWVREVS